jgi:transcriptional regulator with XRE-family HTH domain
MTNNDTKNMKDKRIYGMFGPRIKAMRLEHGLKQRQLAELLETDMPMYSKMELGARRVRRDQVPKLAELYKVDERELMKLWLADGVYAILKEEDETLRLDAIDLAKEYFSGE